MTTASRQFICRIHSQLCVCAKKISMAASDYICDLDGRMLLRSGGFASGPPVLVVSTLVAMGPSAGVASTAPTPPGAGLATAIDGDRGSYAEAGGPTTGHPPMAVTIY